MTEESTIDPDVLAQLEALGREDMREIVDVFLAMLPRRMQSLRSALNSRDMQQVIDVTHALRGSAGTLGLKGAATLAAEMESEAGHGTVTDPENKVEALEQSLVCGGQTLRELCL